MNQQTNVEFVTELMEFSKYGALSQVFVIEALRYYSELISKTVPKDNPLSLIDPKAWHGVAMEIHEKLVQKYESKN